MNTQFKPTRNRNRTTSTGFKECQQRKPDTSNLSTAAKNVVFPTPTITEIIEEYGGDKKAFIQAYALATGTRVDTARRNVDRWLKGRQFSKATLLKIAQLNIPNRHDLKVYLQGCVNISQDYYYKKSRWNNPIVIPASMVQEFIETSRNDSQEGYAMLNGYLFNTGTHDETITWLDNTQVRMDFD